MFKYSVLTQLYRIAYYFVISNRCVSVHNCDQWLFWRYDYRSYKLYWVICASSWLYILNIYKGPVFQKGEQANPDITFPSNYLQILLGGPKCSLTRWKMLSLQCVLDLPWGVFQLVMSTIYPKGSTLGAHLSADLLTWLLKPHLNSNNLFFPWLLWKNGDTEGENVKVRPVNQQIQ